MKNLFMICMMFILSLQANAQIRDSISANSPMGYEDYMRKSKNQKTVAWVMLGGGVAVGLTGLVIVVKNLSLFGGETSPEEKIGGIMFLAGAASAVGSIPVFISSGRNKGKALQLNVKTESLRINNKYVPNTTYPTLSLKIPLGK